MALTLRPEPASPQALDAALARCRQLTDVERARMLDAMLDCVMHDGQVAPEEAELLRAVAWALECPLPLTLN